MKKEFTPEDLAHIRTTYQMYSANLRWMLRHLAAGVVVGLGLHFLFRGFTAPSVTLIVGFVYGAALPSLDYKGPRLGFCAFLRAPVTVVKEFRKRAVEIAVGRRALKERFTDYY